MNTIRNIKFMTAILWAIANNINAVEATPLVMTMLEKRQANVVVQKFDISCGAAALGTLLNYQHGDMVSEKEIAKGLMQRSEYIDHPEIVKNHLGFSLLDLKRYVDNRGYIGTGLGKLSFEDLIERAPMIVAIYIHGYNHFVVFRGVRGDRVLLADPAWGNRTMKRDRFEDVWIEYSKFGRVGFTVGRNDGVEVENKLAPRDDDFVMLQ